MAQPAGGQSSSPSAAGAGPFLPRSRSCPLSSRCVPFPQVLFPTLLAACCLPPWGCFLCSARELKSTKTSLCVKQLEVFGRAFKLAKLMYFVGCFLFGCLVGCWFFLFVKEPHKCLPQSPATVLPGEAKEILEKQAIKQNPGQKAWDVSS